MNKELVKKGYDAAQADIEREQIEHVKAITTATLAEIKKIDQKIEELKTKIKEYEDERKLLRLDIDDLKEGHLDRIEERQKKDKKAKRISVILVERNNHYHYDRWVQPYIVTYPNPNVPIQNTPVWYGLTSTSGSASFTLNNSVAKNYTGGTYDIDGAVVHLR